jgi:hypothetical protein
MKFDQYGDTVWTKNYEYDFNIYLNDIQKYMNGYVVAGGVNGNFLTIRIDNQGNTVWLKESENTSLAQAVKVLPNNDLIIGGITHAKSKLAQDYDVVLMHFNSNGDSLSCRVHEVDGQIRPTSCYITDENNAVFCGTKFYGSFSFNSVIFMIQDKPAQVKLVDKRIKTAPKTFTNSFDHCNLIGSVIKGDIHRKFASGYYITNKYSKQLRLNK